MRTLIRWLRRRFFVRRLNDVTFGPMVPVDGVWSAKVSLSETDVAIRIDVFADNDGPSEYQRQLFVDFRVRYARIHEAVMERLYDPNELSAAAGLESTQLRQSDLKFALYRVEVYGDGWCDLVLDYAVTWDDPDHNLNVALKDWSIIEIMREG